MSLQSHNTALQKRPFDIIRKWFRRITIVFFAEDKQLSVPNVNITSLASLASHNLFQVTTTKLTVVLIKISCTLCCSQVMYPGKCIFGIFVTYATLAKLASSVALPILKVGGTVTQLTLVTLLQRRKLSLLHVYKPHVTTKITDRTSFADS